MPILDQFDLHRRRALITGGSRGLGLEMARALGEAGAEVIIAGSDAAHLDAAVSELRSAGLATHGIQADLSIPDEAGRFCERALNGFMTGSVLVLDGGKLLW